VSAQVLEASTAPLTAGDIPLAVGNAWPPDPDLRLRVTMLATTSQITTGVSFPGRQALLVLEGLRTPVRVRIDQDSDLTSVADIETGVFGAGDTLQAAVEDFRAALQDHLTVLAQQPALSPDLQHQLEFLRSYFPIS